MSARASAAGRALRAGQYLRVSLDKSDRARSLDDQQVENEQAAAHHGWSITATYRDPNVSASRYATKARGAYERLLADLGAGRLDVLILWEPSRGSRRVSEWVLLLELCEEKRVTIHVTSHHRDYDVARPRDRRSLLEDAVDSEYESGKISDRVRRTVTAAAVAGRPHGHVPYGYRRLRDERTGAPLEQVPDEHTAPVVREITARLLAGATLHGIALDLNARQVPTPQGWKAAQLGQPYDGEGWTSSKLRALFKNPTLTGVRSHRKQGGDAGTQPGTWPALISEFDYRRVQRLLADPARAAHHRGVEVRHLLSGIATCAVCGAWLRPQRNRGVPSYLCGGHGPGTGKGHVCRSEKHLDAFVTVAVVRMLADPRLPVAIERVRAGDVDRAGAAAERIADLEDQLARAKRAALAGKISFESFGEFETELQAGIVAAKADRARLSSVSPQVLGLMSPDAAQLWAGIQGDVELQRRVVRELVTVTVGRSSLPRGTQGFDAGSVWVVPRLGGADGAVVDEA